jgi:transposase
VSEDRGRRPRKPREPPVGQKGQLTRQWAKKGSRPRQPKDQRHKAAYLFAAACPETNSAAALVLPKANTDAMTLHLAEISTQVTPGTHAVVVLDQAGWHVAHDLDWPDNISLLFLPPYSPELNPIENLFQFLKHNFLNARVYDTYEDIVDACYAAWSSLLNIKGQLKSITTRSWAKAVNV